MVKYRFSSERSARFRPRNALKPAKANGKAKSADPVAGNRDLASVIEATSQPKIEYCS
jgi:hypothetical protein